MIVFLFTDIEGSTRLWEQYRQQMVPVLQQHDAILYETIGRYGGRVLEHTGDGVYAIFEDGQPLVAALEVQRQFGTADWGPIGELRIRIGMECCAPERFGIDYFPKEAGFFGPVVNQASRIMSAGWGGQILLGPEIVRRFELPAGAVVHDMGLHQLRSMKESIQLYWLTHPSLPMQTFPPLRTRAPQINNLPEQASPFIDRDEERETLNELLSREECRLITLTGPGGIGKSRLSVQVARESLENFRHGTCFVPLAAVESPSYIVPTIADALNLTFYSREEQKHQLVDYLRGKELLLLVDNVEHVSQSTSPILLDILQQAPGIKILTTSRIRLNLRHEWVLDIKGMSVPDVADNPNHIQDYPAVQLFLQTATRVRPGFQPTAEDLTHIVNICQHLEGMPLAIELTAAWTRMLSCREIVEEIEQNPNFLLTTSYRDVPDRHQSLKAVFDYSWSLLDPAGQEVMARLSVFHGGFHRKAAARIADASLYMLSSLLDHSLIQESHIPGRYEIHTLLRQHAAAKLAERPEEALARRFAHARYFLAFVHRQHPRLTGSEQEKALQELSVEIENVRAAWHWALQHQMEQELYDACDALLLFFVIRSRYQEIELLFHTVPAGETTPRIQALVNVGRAVAAYNPGNYAQVLAYLEAAAPLIESIEEGWISLLYYYYLGGTNLSLGRYEEAQLALQRGLALALETNNRSYTARILTDLGVLHRATGNYEDARTIHEEALAICQELGDQWLIGLSIYMLGYVAYVQGDYGAAQARFQESLTIHERMGDYRAVAFASNHLGNIARQRGEFDKAYQLYGRAMSMFQEIGEHRGMAYSHLFLGQVALAQGSLVEAGQQLGRALRTAHRIEAVPLLLQTLLAFGELLAAEQETELRGRLLTLLQNHPAADVEIRRRAGTMLQEGGFPADSAPPATEATLEELVNALLKRVQT